MAIIIFCMPLLTYFFGVIRWTHSDLNSIVRSTQFNITRFNYHHSKSAVEILVLSGKFMEVGQGSYRHQQPSRQQNRKYRRVVFCQPSQPAISNLRARRNNIENTIQKPLHFRFINVKSIDDDKCRRYCSVSETIQRMDPNEFKEGTIRLENNSQCFGRKIYQYYRRSSPYYKYFSEPIIENAYYDSTILTDRSIQHNSSISLLSTTNQIHLPSYILQQSTTTTCIRYQNVKILTDHRGVRNQWKLNDVKMLTVVISTSNI